MSNQGFAAGAAQAGSDDIKARNATALELKMRSSLMEQQAQAASEQSAQESGQRESEASNAQALQQKQFLFAQANQPKIQPQDIVALKAMLGPRATPDQLSQLDQLTGQPVAKLDALSTAAEKFKLGNGQIVPVRDGNGVHIADRFIGPDGDPHDLPIAGSAEKSKEASLIPQYQGYLLKLRQLHKYITNGYDAQGNPRLDASGKPIKPWATTGPSTFSIPSSGQLGAGALAIEGALGYNDLVSEFSKTHDAALNLANKTLEDGPSRTSEAMLNLSKAGNINLGTKDSVVDAVTNDFMDMTNNHLADLRRAAHTGDGQPGLNVDQVHQHAQQQVQAAQAAKKAKFQQFLQQSSGQ